MKPILEIQHISKKFVINHEQQPYLSIRDSISNIFKSKKNKEDFWALQDIDFNVEQGDTFGIIGKNGAGKSTLLKVLSKITPPTSGKIIGRGRIASLLEVGTGFHPELSGRENVFMNGSILGMRRSEILKNFEAIVDFAGVEKFIDTPLKYYSSGMQLRLAFAVAAFLENEILIIDEVLAVGDAEFQSKCMGKMGEVSKSGRTILFVSHQMGAIAQLCKKAIMLQKGKIVANSDVNSVINYYLSSNNTQDIKLDRRQDSTWKSKNHFTDFQMINSVNENSTEFKHDETYHIVVRLHLPLYNDALEIAISVYDRIKNRIFTIHEPLKNFIRVENEIGLRISFPANFLTPGNYSWLMCILHEGIGIEDVQDDFSNFTIIDNGSKFYNYKPGSFGSVFVDYKINNLI